MANTYTVAHNFDPVISVETIDENLPETILKIKEFTELPDGWHFGAGKPASHEAAALAIKLLYHSLRINLTELDAFPGKDGQVSIVIYVGESDHTFQVQPNLSICYWDESNPDSDDEDITFLEAIEKIRNLAWNSFYTYTFASGIARGNTLAAPHSNHRQMEAAYL